MHEFTLIIEGVDVTTEAANALYEAGCDDALFGHQHGTTTLDFCRDAPTIKDAIISAIRDVKRANIGARVLRVEPDPGTTLESDPELDVEVRRLIGA